MRTKTRILKFGAIAFLAIIIVAGAVIFLSGPKLPESTDNTISTIMASELPELVRGDTGYVQSGETSIWYETITSGDPPKGTVLLFMGISNDALGWPPNFIESLADAGY